MSISPPQSQKDRPIGFYLANRPGSGIADKGVSLVIRPEDLVRNEPSRMSAHQTLSVDSNGEATGWVDSFGAGLQTINISGHTGWRRATSGDNALDGLQRFKELYESVFVKWHAYRRQAIKDGKDPDEVELIFIDNLDNFACLVAPTSFNLRRSRSRPLLAQYQIGLTVLSQRIGAVNKLNPQPVSVVQQLGLDSLTTSIKTITDFIDGIRKFIDTVILGPITAFMKLTAKILNLVKSVYTSISGVAASLINVARTIAQAGRNVFQTLAGIANLPTFVKMQMMMVASEYNNVYCLLRNSLKATALYPDYSSLYGSSNCSSTAGGSPPSVFADSNPFYVVSPITKQALVIQPRANASLNTMAGIDPVLSPPSMANMALHLNNVTSGTALT